MNNKTKYYIQYTETSKTSKLWFELNTEDDYEKLINNVISVSYNQQPEFEVRKELEPLQNQMFRLLALVKNLPESIEVIHSYSMDGKMFSFQVRNKKTRGVDVSVPELKKYRKDTEVDLETIIEALTKVVSKSIKLFKKEVENLDEQ